MQTECTEDTEFSRGNLPTWVLFLTLIISTERGPVLNSSSSFFTCFDKGKGKPHKYQITINSRHQKDESNIWGGGDAVIFSLHWFLPPWEPSGSRQSAHGLNTKSLLFARMKHNSQIHK
jgi:hypothetical protein